MSGIIKPICLYNDWIHLFVLEKFGFFLHVYRKETLIYLPLEKTPDAGKLICNEVLTVIV